MGNLSNHGKNMCEIRDMTSPTLDRENKQGSCNGNTISPKTVGML